MKINPKNTGSFSLAFQVCVNFLFRKVQSKVYTGREVFSFSGFFIIVLVTLGLFSGVQSIAQPPALTLGTMGICETSTVSVPLKGSSLSNIGAITLFIKYNDQDLAFNAIENIDPQLSGLIYNVLSNPPRIAIVWSKITGASFLNNPLLNIKFDVLHKSSILTFAQESCEVADNSLPPQIVSVTYNNGMVFDAMPTISIEPENKTVPSSSNASFQVASPNASGYSWQESRTNGSSWLTLTESGPYAGTQTNSLTISNVPTSFNQHRYRCILNAGGCTAVSEDALLVVDSVAGINRVDVNNILQLSNNPNPFDGTTIITYTVPENGFVSIKIFSMTGQLMETPVSEFLTAGTYRISENFVTLPCGIYFCEYVFSNTARVYETYRKIIKIS